MKMRLTDQQRRQAQQLTDPPYPPRYIDQMTFSYKLQGKGKFDIQYIVD
jgi:hypothetical protein